jgi:hypothetical protein
VGKYQFIGLGFLLVITFIMVESAYGTSQSSFSFFAYTNDVGETVSGTEGIFELNYSTIDAVESRFGETFFENSTDTTHVVWWDDTTPDDLVFYSSTLDGLTKTTPILIYTGGGGGFPTVSSVEVYASGNNVFVTWLVETSAGVFSLFEKTSTDNGLTFSVQWTVFSGAVGVAGTNMELVGNSLSDIIVVYRNSTSDTLEARVSHDNGINWTFETLAGDNHGSGNGDGFHNFGDASITMEETSNTINFAFTAEHTGAPCDPVTCDSNFFQQSTDAGDTWLTDPLLINDGLVDHTIKKPFIFVSGSVIDVYYNDDLSSSIIEHARSINGGTSFTTEIGLILGGTCTLGNSFDEWIAVGSGNNIGVFCGDTSNVRYQISTDGGATFSGLESSRSGSFTAKPTNFLGYTNGTVGMIIFNQAGSTMGIMGSGASFDREWYRTPDLFTNAEFLDSEGSVSITDDRVIITTADNTGTDETRSITFEYPVCISDSNQHFNCPFQIGGTTPQDEPTNLAGVATTTGYHSIWQQNGGANPRIYYATTTDAETGTTPLDISGIMKSPSSGSIQDQSFIFENGAGTIDAFWIENSATNAEAFHARSTNGGTSFGGKTSINTLTANIFSIAPVVDGDDLGVTYLNGTSGTDAVPFYVGSGNGGTTWGTPVNIEGGADECNTASNEIRLTKSVSNNLYSAWIGQNQTGSTTGICFNLSTDGGAVWSTTVQNLEDTTAMNGATLQSFEIFSSGSDVTVLWINGAEDILKQSRSTNSGASFGVEEDVINTQTEALCTDPVFLSEVFQDGSSIYAVCEGATTQIKKSTNMGLTYGSLTQISTRGSENWVGISNSPNIVIVAEDDGATPKTGNVVFFSDDDGATWDLTKTTFQNFINHAEFNTLVGNVTHTWTGFIHDTTWDNLADHNYVTLGIFPSGAPPNTAPVVTILGDNPLQHLLDTTYTDAGATCSDSEDGDLTSSIVTVSTVNSAVLGSYTVTYTCTDTGSLVDEEIRNVTVVQEITTTTTTGGGVSSQGSPVGDLPDVGFDQAEFDEALEEALAEIESRDATPLETLVQTFFEFTVIDTEHSELQLNSFLSNERLGFRWSSGNDLVLVSAIPSPSPFMIIFEQLPEVKQGSDAVVSTNFIRYDLEVPRNLCSTLITQNCVERLRYEVPVTLNAVINDIQVSDTGIITVDLTEELIDPILVIILATFAIPIVGVIIQRSRGRGSLEPARRATGI